MVILVFCLGMQFCVLSFVGLVSVVISGVGHIGVSLLY